MPPLPLDFSACTEDILPLPLYSVRVGGGGGCGVCVCTSSEYQNEPLSGRVLAVESLCIFNDKL